MRVKNWAPSTSVFVKSVKRLFYTPTIGFKSAQMTQSQDVESVKIPVMKRASGGVWQIL